MEAQEEQLRCILLAHLGTLSHRLVGHAFVSLEHFRGAVSRTGADARSSPAAVDALFDRLAGDSDGVPWRVLESRLWMPITEAESGE
eukprot:4265599-Prymnesium_polylepis.2